MGLEGNLEIDTNLYYEMYICSEILKGMPHSKFSRLPSEEKLKWYFYTEAKHKKEKLAHKKYKDKLNRKEEGYGTGKFNSKSRG